LKQVNHPMEALTYFCGVFLDLIPKSKKLKLNDSSFLFPSQSQYLKHFANLMDDVKV
jgi:hypothetical protein